MRKLSGFMLAALVLLTTAAPVSAQHAPDAFVGQMAPELKTSEWINSEPLTLEGLRGRVVMLEFWAWDCPECAQAMPHVVALHEKYADRGVVVIGIHTPRIDYEKDVVRLRETMERHGIRFPVTLDHEYLSWLDYLNNVWPSHFVLDQQGVIQLSQSGVGRYEETEQVIQRLLESGGH